MINNHGPQLNLTDFSLLLMELGDPELIVCCGDTESREVALTRS